MIAATEQTQIDIAAECDALKEMLLEKNRAYGDSALDPVRIFSKADTVEQILVRIDDKLSRLKRGLAGGEDVERDLLGYLILLRIARRRANPRTAAQDSLTEPEVVPASIRFVAGQRVAIVAGCEALLDPKDAGYLNGRGSSARLEVVLDDGRARVRVSLAGGGERVMYIPRAALQEAVQ